MSRANPQSLSESITGASQKEARRYVDRYRRLDGALNSFSSDSGRRRIPESNVSMNKINALFDKYKDRGGDEITVNGTLKLCEDLAVDPEDIVLLAIAYELKSPRVGEWTRMGWIDGLRNLGCDSLQSIKSTLPQLRERLRSDVVYFRAVYNHTFNFTRSEGQRSLAIDTALAYWELLLPFGLSGGALKHHPSSSNDTSTTPLLNRDVRYRNNHYQDADIDMDGESEDEDEKDEDREEGWGNEHTEWWLEYMRERGGRGVSKDTWQMVRLPFYPVRVC
ncbi:Cullin binding-domain-containing protein [Scleroderma yunnanense]